MTADNINSFVGNLVEMAKAYEELPSVKHDLAVANETIQRNADTVTDRELSILSLKAEIEILNSRIRSVEAERDDAELRFLESDDKAGKALAALGHITASLNDAKAALTPPAPEPEPITPPTPDATPVDINEGGSPYTEAEHAFSGSASNIDSVGVGVSSDPSAPVGEDAFTPPSVASSADAVTGTDPTLFPYYGKRYIDVPGYVSRYDWIEGGGTEENYDLR